MKIPFIRSKYPFAVTDTNAVANNAAMTEIEKADTLLQAANKCRNLGNMSEATRIYDLALSIARRALGVVRGQQKKNEVNALIKTITENKNLPDGQKAKNMMNTAGILASYGYYEDARKLYEMALALAEKVKDQNIVSQVKLEMGRFYYYKTGNTGKAIDCFNSVIYNPGARVEDAINALKDMRDIENFKYSQLNAAHSYRHGTGGSRSETLLNGDLSLNSISPSTYDSVGGLGLGFTYRNADFLHSKDLSDAMVRQQNIDADPGIPDYMRRLKDVRYPTLDIAGMESMNLRINYSFPAFGGPLTLPLRLYEGIPVINVGYGLTYTTLDATYFHNYKYMESSGNYEGEAVPKQLRSYKHTIPISLEFGSWVANEGRYAFSWYFTPYVGTEMSILSANARSVYNFMDGKDQSRPDNVWSRNQTFGVRIATPRVKVKWLGFESDDNAGRYNINLRYQIDRDSTINSENGMWPVYNPNTGWPEGDTAYSHQARVCSLHLGIDHDIEFLRGTEQEKADSLDKTPLKVTIPVALQFGLSDLGAMHNKKVTGYYTGASIGFRMKGWEGKLGCSYSTDGKGYNESAFSLSIGKRF